MLVKQIVDISIGKVVYLMLVKQIVDIGIGKVVSLYDVGETNCRHKYW